MLRVDRPPRGVGTAPDYLVEGETVTALVDDHPVGVAAVRPERVSRACAR